MYFPILFSYISFYYSLVFGFQAFGAVFKVVFTMTNGCFCLDYIHIKPPRDPHFAVSLMP